MSICDLPFASELTDISYLKKLWRAAWGKPYEHFFEIRVVERDGTTEYIVPEKCLVLKELAGTSVGDEFGIRDIFIRHEYVKALEDIVTYFATGERKFAVNSDDDEISSDDADEDMSGSEGLASDESSFPLHVDIPFASEMFSKPKRGEIIIVGHPGIGKSLFLYFVLVLRLLAKLPTIYQVTSDRFCYFNSDSVFVVDVAKMESWVLSRYMAMSTWCLVDSSTSLKTVPECIANLRLFVVQMASPRREHLNWMRKVLSTKYIMKPWTLAEVIAARSLQTIPNEVPSETELEAYFQRYVPSVRMAYIRAGTPDWLEDELRGLAFSTSYETLSKIFADSAQLDLSQELSHWILLVKPGRFRDVPSIVVPTKHMFNLLHDSLAERTSDAVTQLYKIFVQTPYTRANAGYVIEEAFRRAFQEGGQWVIKPMSPRRMGDVNRTWELPKRTAKPEWLCLGYGDDIMHIASNELRTQFHHIDPIKFKPKQKLVRKDALYYPSLGKQAISDAFVYEYGSHRATIFQAKVGGSHKVNVDELRWLKSLGAKEFHYVAVTPPCDSLNIRFPKDWDGLVTKKYHLVLLID